MGFCSADESGHEEKEERRWMWDVHAATSRYLSTDLIISDAKGDLMHYTARGNIAHNFLWLKEGVIYSVKNFTVVPNKDEFCMMRFAELMLEFDGETTIQKSFVKSDSFTRYPFQFVEIDALEPTNNRYLIDVAGYVTNVGRTTQTRTCSKTLDFYLANCTSDIFCLVGGLGDMLIQKRTRRLGLYPVIITVVSVKLYNNRLYLSSTSSTLIIDDEKIPVLQRMKTDDRRVGVELTKEILHADNAAPKPGNLENLLMLAHNRKYDSATFLCEVKIDKVRTKKDWNYPSCGGEKCKKGPSTRRMCIFGATHATAQWSTLYRLELEISDNTAKVVVIMFDETTTSLLGCFASCILDSKEQDEEDHSGLPTALANIMGTTHTLELKSHTYFEHGNYESFTCWNIVTAEDEEGGEGGASSGTVATNEASKVWIYYVRERVKDSNVEESFVAESVSKEGDMSCSSDTRKRRRVVLDESEPKAAGQKGTKTAALSSSVSYHNLGALTYKCRECNATMRCEERNNKGNRAVNPTFSLCCQQGKVLLPRFNETSEPLKRLLDYSQSATSRFRDQIRIYNGMFCLTSFGARIDHLINAGMGLYTFCINGQNYHRIELRLISKRTSSRQYNASTVAEVAALITNDFRDGVPTRDIIVTNKDSGLQRISELHPSYMALQYPLLFPYGEDGYHDKIPYHSNTGTCKTNRVVYVIEFQKRGLPHAYILLWLEEQCKCKTPDHIDDIISAELPSPTDEPVGYKAVTDYMLHGPCGKDARLYLAPCEAVWRILSFDIHYSYPSVMKLNFHLPNQNPVTLRDSECLPALLEREAIDVTMFTDWFNLNEQHPPARTLTIVYSNPAAGERYFLRMLLNVVRGAQSFEELLMVNKRVCVTFKEACFYYGLLNDDREWTRAIQEASDTGKTFLYKTIISRLRSERKIVLAVASSGIAFLLLPAGRTTHIGFIIPLKLLENSTCGIKQNTHLAELMQEFSRLHEAWGVNEYYANGVIDTPKQDFNQWVLAVGDGKLPAKIKDGEDEPSWIEIPK
ncbi:ATP-dependent DNA helicase PIF1-like protein [Tanacetum coccineum]